MKRLLAINKFTPPDSAPTAKLLESLCRRLHELGWDVEYLNAGSSYRQFKKTGWKRWVSELTSHLRLLWGGLTAEKPSVIFCLSDPPALLVTAALIARCRRVPLVHWVMDVYPQIAVALGELKAGSPIERLVSLSMRWAYDQCCRIGCMDQDMAKALDLQNDPRLHLCPPWPPVDTPVPEKSAAPSGDRIRWIYSGNLGRAHEYETLLNAQRILEEKNLPIELIFQGGGPLWQPAQQLSQQLGLRHCKWLGYVSDQDLILSLLASNVLIATQKTETQGLLWPSKLALLRLLPRPIVWIGPSDGTISKEFSEGQHGACFEPGEDVKLAEWLALHKPRLLLMEPFTDGSVLRKTLAQTQDRAITDWIELINQL